MAKYPASKRAAFCSRLAARVKPGLDFKEFHGEVESVLRELGMA
jgi:hypothetical protein